MKHASPKILGQILRALRFELWLAVCFFGGRFGHDIVLIRSAQNFLSLTACGHPWDATAQREQCSAQLQVQQTASHALGVCEFAPTRIP